MDPQYRLAVLLFLGLFVLSPAIEVQGQGIVTGQVVQAGTLRPLVAAQVSIPGTGLGALATSDGRYQILNVPAGDVSLQVQAIGYGTTQRTVTVTAGETTVVDFQLESRALGLDEIVVTGTGGTTQRRAVANVVSTVNTGELLETSSPANMLQLLGGQVAGAAVRLGDGQVGGGNRVMIRGMSTLSLDTGPLIYVDGVRVDGRTEALANGTASSRLNDINPEDIERIEVIKGPAAATLYGTEATNGVIQIITKKGTPGRAVVDVTVRQGVNWFHDPAGRVPTNYAIENGQIVSHNIFQAEKAAGRQMFRYGQIQATGASVRGGTDRLNYFFSGNYENEEGYELNNALQRFLARSNLQTSLSDNLDVSLDLGVVRSEAQYAMSGTAEVDGLFTNIVYGSALTRDLPQRGFSNAPQEFHHAVQLTEDLNRATTSLTVSYRPTSWLSHRLVTGFDWTDSKRSNFHPRLPPGLPPFYAGNSTGRKLRDWTHNLQQTVDYNASAGFDLSPTLTSTTTVGVQYFTTARLTTTTSGSQLPTPAVSTVGSGAVRNAGETFLENKTFGVFVQETLGWENQVFVTAAVRADANSAFGEEFDAAYYPKLSGSWVISDADFWNVDFAETFRLRAAWGKSGLQPAAFAAVRTYTPVTGPGDQPTVTPGNLGNPGLRPEVASELELGVDASLFNGRVSAELTHYRQTTRDAILQEAVAPSGGFAGTRFVNAGTIRNWGWEAKVDVHPIMTNSIQLTLTPTISHNSNLLVDLGGRTFFADTRGRWQHHEGFPLGGSWSKYIATAEWGPDNRLQNVTCRGPAENNFAPVPCGEAPFHFVGNSAPSWTGGFLQSLTVGGQLTLSAYWVFSADARRYNTTWWKRDRTSRNTLEAVTAILGEADPIRAAEMVTSDIEHPWHNRDDYVRLRDLSAAYRLPSGLVDRLGASSAMITMSGRNLVLFKHSSFKDFDPESRRVWNEPWGWDQAQGPVPNSFVTTIRMSF